MESHCYMHAPVTHHVHLVRETIVLYAQHHDTCPMNLTTRKYLKKEHVRFSKCKQI